VLKIRRNPLHDIVEYFAQIDLSAPIGLRCTASVEKYGHERDSIAKERRAIGAADPRLNNFATILDLCQSRRAFHRYRQLKYSAATE